MKTLFFCLVQILVFSSMYSQKAFEWNVKNDTTLVFIKDTKITLIGANKSDSLGYNNTLRLVLESEQSFSIVKSDNILLIYDSILPIELGIVSSETKISYLQKNTANTSPNQLTIKLQNSDKSGNTKDNQNTQTLSLPDIECRYGEANSDLVKYSEYIEGGNKILIIDASPFVSAKSGIYRKSNKGISKCNYLTYGDFVKVYIENLNPYLYDVKVSSASKDIGAQVKKTNTDNSGTLESGESVPEYSKLENYSKATNYLLKFIECVKTNRNPISDVLENHKSTIRHTLKSAGISPDQNIQELYNKLQDTLKENYKSEYELAKKFASVYKEFENLSYTIESTVLPIRIKSYDKLSITISLRDKDNNNIINEQEYEFL